MKQNGPAGGKAYRFYGWENADVRDRNGLTPRDYYDILSDLWCRETCAVRMRKNWTPDNPTWGQCSITAFLMQDVFGGKVYGIPLDSGYAHCFNTVGDCLFDLTSEQFGDTVLDYTRCTEQSREAHFAMEDKRARYDLLKQKLTEALGRNGFRTDFFGQ